MIEIIGWIGTAAVLVSFLMKDMLKLRLMNLSGCLIWVSYAIIKEDYPVLITNAAVAIIHAYWFYQNFSKLKEYKKHE